MTRTEFLKSQTVSGQNKCRRTPLPALSVAHKPCSLAERKALALCEIFKKMPVFIGEKEWIVGTRTFFTPAKGNEDGHNIFAYKTATHIPYINEQEEQLFGCNQSYSNKTHYAPDFSIILENGINGIIAQAEQRKKDTTLHAVNIDFLSSVVIAYNGLKTLICRYAEEARSLAEKATGEEKEELLNIAAVCQKISGQKPDTLREAIQLLWFTHLGTMIESFDFINYGRLDVILGKYVKETPKEEAKQLIECLLLKMYDQADLVHGFYGKYAAQLVVTLGGVLPNGESAVNEATMLFLEAIDTIRLPEPECNLRISTKNPPEFLDKAAALSISGCNFISYYNDDLFVNSLHAAGIPLEYARDYGFDLCQDINIPGRSDFFVLHFPFIVNQMMDVLKTKQDFKTFNELLEAVKTQIAAGLASAVERYNKAEAQIDLYAKGKIDAYFEGIQNGLPVGNDGVSPMSPLPLLSALYHGSIENALDIVCKPYPIKAKGVMFGTATEAINSLAAIKKTVYEDRVFTLEQIVKACECDFSGTDGLYIKTVLWNCPKWGNDDDYADSIAKDLLEFCLSECKKYKTYYHGQVLGGIHQPHPVFYGKDVPATPEGRNAGTPIAVTLTPENGTMKNGPTAALRSAAKIDPMLVQWNYCVMVNYFSSVFSRNNGKDIFKDLLNGYFEMGGLQHQPNVLDVEELKKAQAEPEKYKDLIVRLWGVSAHFVDLPRNIQDEMIARFS